MKDRKRSYSATVQMVIDVEADGRWGGDCTMGQIEDQAAREAKQGFENAMQHIEKPYRCHVSAATVQHVRIRRSRS